MTVWSADVQIIDTAPIPPVQTVGDVETTFIVVNWLASTQTGVLSVNTSVRESGVIRIDGTASLGASTQQSSAKFVAAILSGLVPTYLVQTGAHSAVAGPFYVVEQNVTTQPQTQTWQASALINGAGTVTSSAKHTAQGAVLLNGSGVALAVPGFPFLLIVDAAPTASPLTASDVQANQVTFTWLASTQTSIGVDSTVLRAGQALVPGVGVAIAAGQVVAATAVRVAIAGAAATTVATLELAQAQAAIAGIGSANSQTIATYLSRAALTGVGSDTANTTAIEQGVATIAGLGATVTPALRIAQGVVPIAGAGVATAGAILVDRQPTVTITGVGVGAANGTHTPAAAAGVIGAGTVVAAGTPIDRQTLILSNGVGSATADSIHTPLAASSILLVGNVASAPFQTATATAALSGTASSATQNILIAAAQIDIVHAGLGFTNATHTPRGAIQIAGNGDAVSESIQLFGGPGLFQAFVALVGNASVAQTVYLLESVAPQIDGVGTSVLLETVIAQSTSAVAGTGAISTAARHTPAGNSLVSGATAVGVTAKQVFTKNPTVMNGAVSSAVTGAVLTTATSQPITATASVTTVAQVLGALPTAINSSASVAVSASVNVAASINLAGTTVVTANSSHTPAGDSLIAGVGAAASGSTITEFGVAEIDSFAALAVAALHTPNATAAIVAEVSVTSTELLIPAVHVTSDGAGATVFDETLVTAIDAAVVEIDGLGIAAAQEQQGVIVDSLIDGVGRITVIGKVEPIYSSDIALQGSGNAFLSVNIVVAPHAETVAPWRTVRVGSITPTQRTQV